VNPLDPIFGARVGCENPPLGPEVCRSQVRVLPITCLPS
jgi:hypothetical protein